MAFSPGLCSSVIGDSPADDDEGGRLCGELPERISDRTEESDSSAELVASRACPRSPRTAGMAGTRFPPTSLPADTTPLVELTVNGEGVAEADDAMGAAGEREEPPIAQPGYG